MSTLLEFVLFMVFSVIETIALISITFALYRYKMKNYLWQSLVMIIIMNLVSFYLRNEVSLADYAPLAFIVLSILFMMAIVRMPAFWAIVVSLTGMLFFSLLQTGVIMQLSFGFLSLDQIHAHAWKGYLLQALTGVIGYLISVFMYNRGFGFSFEFDRLPFFRVLTFVSMIVIILIGLAFVAVLFIGNSYIASVVYLIGLAFLLYLALRKETEDAKTGL